MSLWLKRINSENFTQGDKDDKKNSDAFIGYEYRVDDIFWMWFFKRH